MKAFFLFFFLSTIGIHSICIAQHDSTEYEKQWAGDPKAVKISAERIRLMRFLDEGKLDSAEIVGNFLADSLQDSLHLALRKWEAQLLYYCTGNYHRVASVLRVILQDSVYYRRTRGCFYPGDTLSYQLENMTRESTVAILGKVNTSGLDPEEKECLVLDLNVKGGKYTEFYDDSARIALLGRAKEFMEQYPNSELGMYVGREILPRVSAVDFPYKFFPSFSILTGWLRFKGGLGDAVETNHAPLVITIGLHYERWQFQYGLISEQGWTKRNDLLQNAPWQQDHSSLISAGSFSIGYDVGYETARTSPDLSRTLFAPFVGVGNLSLESSKAYFTYVFGFDLFWTGPNREMGLLGANIRGEVIIPQYRPDYGQLSGILYCISFGFGFPLP
jgi:hypothetical protein